MQIKYACSLYTVSVLWTNTSYKLPSTYQNQQKKRKIYLSSSSAMIRKRPQTFLFSLFLCFTMGSTLLYNQALVTQHSQLNSSKDNGQGKRLFAELFFKTEFWAALDLLTSLKNIRNKSGAIFIAGVINQSINQLLPSPSSILIRIRIRHKTYVVSRNAWQHYICMKTYE